MTDHHYRLAVRSKDEEDVIVYPHSVSTIWEFALQGELPEDIAERMSVKKGGPSEQPAVPIFYMVIGRYHAELLPQCLARSYSALCGDNQHYVETGYGFSSHQSLIL
jgi:hypothetical protein